MLLDRSSAMWVWLFAWTPQAVVVQPLESSTHRDGLPVIRKANGRFAVELMLDDGDIAMI